MATTQSYRLKNPPHPGGFVRTEIINPMGVSVTAAASALGVTRAALSGVVERAFGAVPENGSTYREGFRCPYGYADADAEQLRHIPGAAQGG